MKTLTYLPIAVAIATSGCHKELPKEPIITSEYEMKCDYAKNEPMLTINRCENKEAICYITPKSISCFRKRFSK